MVVHLGLPQKGKHFEYYLPSHIPQLSSSNIRWQYKKLNSNLAPGFFLGTSYGSVSFSVKNCTHYPLFGRVAFAVAAFFFAYFDIVKILFWLTCRLIQPRPALDL